MLKKGIFAHPVCHQRVSVTGCVLKGEELQVKNIQIKNCTNVNFIMGLNKIEEAVGKDLFYKITVRKERLNKLKQPRTLWDF